MTTKQPLSEVINHVTFKLDKMVEEIKKTRSNVISLLKLFNETSFKSDEQYVEKKERLTNYLNKNVLDSVKKGRGFMKKKFDRITAELRHIHGD
jgi:hypothetical protein